MGRANIRDTAWVMQKAIEQHSTAQKAMLVESSTWDTSRRASLLFLTPVSDSYTESKVPRS